MEGRFCGILDSFMMFEEKYSGYDQRESRMFLMKFQVRWQSRWHQAPMILQTDATNQAAVVEELTATVAGVSEQVEREIHSLQRKSVQE